MTPLEAGLLFGVGSLLLALIVVLAERRGLFDRDGFPSRSRRATGLGLLLLTLVVAILLPASTAGQPVDTSRLTFSQVFFLQAVLAAFLLAWWLLGGRPRTPQAGGAARRHGDVVEFLGLASDAPAQEAAAGVLLGVLGWIVTILIGALIATILDLLGSAPNATVPPLVRWLGLLPAPQRVLVVLSAMSVEELFFRAFLQRRLGAVAASLLFLLAHGGYGEPLVLVGLSGITVVLAAAYARTGSVVAPILAHGTFDAIQLFVVLPQVLRSGG